MSKDVIFIVLQCWRLKFNERFNVEMNLPVIWHPTGTIVLYCKRDTGNMYMYILSIIWCFKVYLQGT